MSRPLKVLAISGSLRRGSTNTAMLQAMAQLAPPDMAVTLFDGLGALPHFNPDIESDEIASVGRYRAALAEADGVLISTPEYAHGIPGVMKNALDWVVGSGELVEKPIALINPSPRSSYAQAAIMEVLWTMSGRLIEEAFVAVQMMGRKLPEGGMASDAEIAAKLRESLATLARIIRA
ncbi:MAG TPA: NADPH-dependent FMN reductase [Magnetospirillaceae bacterium]|jgi:NAD(P)H-dependent FMN reductase